MSYCRIGKNSDVYAYRGIDDADKPVYVCCGCLLPEYAPLKAAFDDDGKPRRTPQEM